MISKLSLAARALVCSILVLVAGGANAATLSLTQTAGGATLVGEPDGVSAFTFGGGVGNFLQQLGTLSPVIVQDVTNGTSLFEVDLTGTGLGNLAFQDVIFTSAFVLQGSNQFVSFRYES